MLRRRIDVIVLARVFSMFEFCDTRCCLTSPHTSDEIPEQARSQRSCPRVLTTRVTTHTITENDVGEDTWVQAVQHRHMILLNVAIGGAFRNGDRGSATPLPVTVPGLPLYADWFAVYNSA
jgi:hypothetical protein